MRVPYLRQPYGPRRPRRYVDNATSIPAADVPQVTHIAQQMPRGGYRLMGVCPVCQNCVSHLYVTSDRYVCRRCAGLRYRSQYEGRRIEATVERRRVLRASAENAKSPITRERRLARAETAFQIWSQRQNDYEDRSDWAMIALMRSRRK